MSRYKRFMFGFMVTLAISAVVSTSASAAKCKKEANKKFVLCLGEPLVLTEGTLTIHVKTDPMRIFILEREGIKVECSKIEGLGAFISKPGVLVNETKILNLVIKLSECSVQGVANCKAEPITTLPLRGIIEAKERVEFLPEKEKEEHIATVTFVENGGACAIAGKEEIKTKAGKGPLCIVEWEKTHLEQLFACLKENSAIEFGEKPGTFGGEFLMTLLKASVETEWAVVEGK